MTQNQTLGMILLCFLLAGCPANDMNSIILSDYKDVRTVSVSLFTCSDPLISRDVQNAITGTLLESFSVIIGREADVVVTGTITLSSDKKVSEIKAHIMKNKKIVDSVTVTQKEVDVSLSDSPEAMGRKTGNKIKELLSR